jgi:hypothetical protein
MIKVHSNCPTACVPSKLMFIYTKFHYTKLRDLAGQGRGSMHSRLLLLIVPHGTPRQRFTNRNEQVEGEGHPNQDELEGQILTCNEAMSGAASHGRPHCRVSWRKAIYMYYIYKIQGMMRPTRVLLYRGAQVENAGRISKGGGGGGEQLEHQPWQPAMASMAADLFFSLVCKSRPQLNESS